MKCLYLNVNGGLEAKLQGGKLKEVMCEYDIVMFCETMTSECSDLCVSGFAEPVCVQRKKKKHAKSESGGIACFFKEEIAHGVEVEHWSFEDGITFKLNKHVFGLNEDMYMLCVYMRSNASTREDINDGMNCYDIVCDEVARLSDRGGVIVVGDMNARVGGKQDWVAESVDVVNTNHVFNDPLDALESINVNRISECDLVANDISLERVNVDKGTNEYGFFRHEE